MMKIKTYKYLLLIWLVTGGLLCSCAKDESRSIIDGPEDSATKVQLSVKMPGGYRSTRALGDEQETDVGEIIVFAFYPGDESALLRKVGRSIGSPTLEQGNLKFTVELYSGVWDLMVVANSQDIVNGLDPDLLTNDFIVGEYSKGEIQKKLTLTNAGKWNVNENDPGKGYRIPMWGMRNNVEVATSSNDVIKDIYLFRMLAKVEVIVQRDPDSDDPVKYPGIAESDFELTHVSIHNYNTVGCLVPGLDTALDGNWTSASGEALRPSLPDNPGSVNGYNDSERLEWGVNDLTTGKTALQGTIYTFENTAGSSNADHPCIIIGGKYDGSDRVTYYRADFIGRNKEYLPILRNFCYRLNIRKIGGEGYGTIEDAYKAGPTNMEVQVVYWNDSDLEDIWDDGMYHHSVGPLQPEHYGLASVGNRLKVYTTYRQWSYELSDRSMPRHPEADPSTIDWLNVTSHTAGQNYPGEGNADYILYNISENTGGELRTAYIHITAGRFEMTVTIRQNAWYISSVSVSPIGNIGTDGETREVRITGYFDDTPVRAWDLSNDEIIKEEIVGKGTDESAPLVIPRLWHPTDRTKPNDITVAFEYFSLEHDDWRLIRTEDQASYYLTVDSNLGDGDVIRGSGWSFDVSAWGNYPDITVRAVTEDKNEVLAEAELIGGKFQRADPQVTQIKIPNNHTGDIRTIFLEYLVKDEAVWNPFVHGVQAIGNLKIPSTGRLLAMEDCTASGNPNGNIQMSWATAMGIDPINDKTFFGHDGFYGQANAQNRYYEPDRNTGCGAYYENDDDKGKWRLPALNELVDALETYPLSIEHGHFYHSSSENGMPQSHRAGIYPATLQVSTVASGKTSLAYARCVRDED